MKIDRPIIIAIIFLAIVLLVFFLVMPEYKTFKSLRTELGERRAEYNAEFEYYAEITKTYYELKSRPDDIKKIDDALPENPNLGKLIYFFQETAAQNGMIIKDLFLSKSSSPNSSADKNSSAKVKDMTFSIDLLGDYSALQNLIISLEKSARLFEVLGISFNTGSLIRSPSALSQFQIPETYGFNLQVKTYSY